jgi:hypothetical protein
LLLFAGVMYWSDETTLRGPVVAQALEDFEEQQHPRMVVVGPQVLSPNEDNTYEITTQSLSGGALSTPLQASLEDQDGNRLWHESLQTGADGKQTVDLPADKLRGSAVRLKIQVEPSDKSDQLARNGASLDTWLAIQEQRGELSVVNQVAGGERMFFREAEIRTLDRAGSSDTLSKLSESSRSESMQRSKKSQAEDNVLLAKEADRVRWRTERFAEVGIDPKKEGESLAEESGEAKPRVGESVKQLHEALPGRSVPVRAPAPTGKPGADVRQDRTNNAPGPPPRDAQALPATPPEPGESKKELPRLQPGTVDDTPAPEPVTTAPAPAATPAEPVAERDELDLSKAIAEVAGKKVLLESITANEKVVASRMVEGTEVVPSLEQRIDDLRKEGRIDAKFSGRIGGVWYDATVAPPQKVAETSVDIPPDVETLICSVLFDRAEYRAGDLVTAELRVTDADSQLLPAVLNVQVDAIPATQADEQQSPASPHYLYTYAESPQAPLVFDNATQQTQSINQALASRLAERRAGQRSAALWLLGGSGVGFCLLGLAWKLKWLPGGRYAAPVAVLLGCSTVLGVFWLPREAAIPPVVVTSPSTPLTTFGIQSEPPESEKQTPGQLQYDASEMEKLVWDNPTLLDDLDMLETAGTPDGKEQAQTLVAMSDWERLAERREQSDFGVNGRADATSPTPSAFLRADDLTTLPWAGFAFRQYASARGLGTDESATPRQPQRGQTVYWSPRLTTDPSGTCRIQFRVPSGPMAHRLTVIAHGNGRLGTMSKVIPTVVRSDDSAAAP